MLLWRHVPHRWHGWGHVLEARNAGAPDHLVREVVDHGEHEAVNNRNRESRAALREREENAGRKGDEEGGDVEHHEEVHLYIHCSHIIKNKGD